MLNHPLQLASLALLISLGSWHLHAADPQQELIIEDDLVDIQIDEPCDRCIFAIAPPEPLSAAYQYQLERLEALLDGLKQNNEALQLRQALPHPQLEALLPHTMDALDQFASIMDFVEMGKNVSSYLLQIQSPWPLHHLLVAIHAMKAVNHDAPQQSINAFVSLAIFLHEIEIIREQNGAEPIDPTATFLLTLQSSAYLSMEEQLSLWQDLLAGLVAEEATPRFNLLVASMVEAIAPIVEHAEALHPAMNVLIDDPIANSIYQDIIRMVNFETAQSERPESDRILQFERELDNFYNHIAAAMNEVDASFEILLFLAALHARYPNQAGVRFSAMIEFFEVRAVAFLLHDLDEVTSSIIDAFLQEQS